MLKLRWKICLIALALQACAVPTPAPRVYVPRRRLSRPSKRKTAAPTQRPYAIAGKTYHPIASEKGFIQEGMASWYGKDFHGRLTANGEVYDMYAETAAHKTLPMNTYIRVTNLRNRRQITVRVNDRGPFVKGRIVDLSHTGAERLGMLESGTAPVRVEALGRKVISKDKKVRFVPMDFSQGNFSLQVGAFKEKTNAERLVGHLSTRYANAHWVVFDSSGGRFYRVRVGKYNNLEKAEAARREFEKIGFAGSFIVGE